MNHELHWCALCLNVDNRVRHPATTVLPTRDGTICVCEHHAGVDEQLSTVDNILRAKGGTDASRRAT